MRTKRKPTRQKRTAPHKATSVPATQPFIDHAQELRRRFYYIAISVVAWGGIIYSVQQHVVNALLKPAKGQHFIYTTPGGGIDFLFRICVYGGIVLSLPVIIYNTLRFIEPLIDRRSRRFVTVGSLAATVLAALGVVFGYYVGLPAALHFLLHQFTTVQIQPLVTIQAYLGFVIVYMFGSALLFQLPLLLLFINRIKPLKPKRLLHYERWVILAAFIMAGLMNPSPNIVSQLLVAGPFIIAYQVAIVLIAIINRPKRTSHIQRLFEQDELLQQQRQQRVTEYKPLSPPLFVQASQHPLPLTRPTPIRAIRPSPAQRPARARQLARPLPPDRRRFMDFTPSPATRSLRPLLEGSDRAGQPRIAS